MRAEQESAEYRVEAPATDAEDPLDPFRKWLGRLNPENRVLALEFVKMLSRLQEAQATRKSDMP